MPPPAHISADAFDSRQHVERLPNGSLAFNASAVEITILDRRGRSVWRMRRGIDGASIHWDGVDMAYRTVTPGAYTCKIVYADKNVVYVPFIFMK